MGRQSHGNYRSVVQPLTTPKPNKQAQTQATPNQPTPKTGILGPPTNLASRFEQRQGSKGQDQDKAWPRFTHSASSTSIGIKRQTQQSQETKPKRNPLMAQFSSKPDNFKTSRAAEYSQEDSEHLIDIMLHNNMSGGNLNHSKAYDIESSHSMLKASHSPVLRQSLEMSTPGTNQVLHDSTNGLSSMKEKLRTIQDNKQLLEKKIQEYERKLKCIQKKGAVKKNDENYLSA